MKFLFLIILLSCTKNTQNIQGLQKKIPYAGCFAQFDQDKITYSYCSEGLNLNSQFLIASLSKMFLGASLLKLEEENKIASRDIISEHLPELKKSQDVKLWDTLRLYHLVKHRSGVANFYNSKIWRESSFKKIITRDEFLDFLVSSAIDRNYTGLYQYSNTGYIMLGEILRRKTNQTMSENYKWQFFVPLEMNNTMIGINPKIFSYNNTTKNAPEIHVSDLFTDGNIASTITDMTLWSQAILNKKNIFKDKLSYTKYLKPSTDGYAYGLIVFKNHNLDLATHSGAWAGYRSSIMLDLNNKKGAIYLSHEMSEEDFNNFTKESNQLFFLKKIIH